VTGSGERERDIDKTLNVVDTLTHLCTRNLNETSKLNVKSYISFLFELIWSEDHFRVDEFQVITVSNANKLEIWEDNFFPTTSKKNSDFFLLFLKAPKTHFSALYAWPVKLYFRIKRNRKRKKGTKNETNREKRQREWK